MELVQKFQAVFVDQTPSHGLDCNTSSNETLDSAHQFLVKFTVQESAKITQAPKTLRLTFSKLLDAACIVASFEQNPVPAHEVDAAPMKGSQPQHRAHRLPPFLRRPQPPSSPVSSPRPSTASTTLPLFCFAGKPRLLDVAMRQAKAQYDLWLANPCLPHLIADLYPHFAPMMTNVERVEDYAAGVWDKDVLQEYVNDIANQICFVLPE
ncbi:hypothetical protein LXA43DRAFT_1101933 [Ganoderma leucocontextum]|nr:hypothetical protein LXA43DRAFT_1101933 [Ganoderma leucocontextum]